MSTDSQSTHILDSYLKIINTLECPVCLEYLHSSIYQCVSGHVLCHNCIKTVKDCPTCRGQIDASTRVRSLEYVADVILVPCRNDGCSVAHPLKDVLTHENNCSFPKFELGRDKQAMQNNLLSHVEEYVSPFFVTKSSTTFANQETQTINSSTESASSKDHIEKVISQTFSAQRQSYKLRKIKGLKKRVDVETNAENAAVMCKASHKYKMKKKVHPNETAESEAGVEENNDNDVQLFISNIWNKAPQKIDWSFSI